jgi:hypothetical protein
VWQHVISFPWWCVCCLLCRVKLHNDVLLPIILINVALSRLICRLPDDGRRPKHVGAILIRLM